MVVDEVDLALVRLCLLPALGKGAERLTGALRARRVHRQLLQLLLELLLLLLRRRRRRRLLGL